MLWTLLLFVPMGALYFCACITLRMANKFFKHEPKTLYTCTCPKNKWVFKLCDGCKAAHRKGWL